jgi:hypothetical protein
MPAAEPRISTIQITVSRIAGPSERCINSFIVLRATSVWYHSAEASPVSIARRVLSPTRL